MRKLLLAAALAISAPALAQIQVHVQLPSIVFPAPPPLVVVEPGVQVVDNYDEEVFFVDGFYWHHNGPNWYRTNAYTGGWVLVEPRFVPQRIVFYQPGHFRRWHGSDDQRREWKEWRKSHEREEARTSRRSRGPPTTAVTTAATTAVKTAVKTARLRRPRVHASLPRRAGSSRTA